MKKIFTSIASLILSACCATALADAPKVIAAEIEAGRVTVYDFGSIKLHAYMTGDALSDVCYLLEAADAVVLLESPPFKDNLAAWNAYIQKIEKPVVGALMAYHPNGADTYGGMKVYTTQNAVNNWGEGGGIRALTDNFINIFGEAFDNVMPQTAEIVPEGEKVTLGGLDFNIIAAGDDAYGVEIPAINCVYRHMMGSNCHNILVGSEHIDATIAELKGYQEKGYELVLTSHALPEGQEAVATKIAYLEKVKELAKENTSKAAFLEAMNAEFPDYDGANYLEMTAGFLFP